MKKRRQRYNIKNTLTRYPLSSNCNAVTRAPLEPAGNWPDILALVKLYVFVNPATTGTGVDHSNICTEPVPVPHRSKISNNNNEI